MTRLKVAVRVRPLSKREIDLGSTSVISVENGDTLEITNLKVHEQNTGDSRQRIRRFAFDSCFQDSSTQEQVFESIEKVISKSIKQRCHSCVLAYGQSSTGKTHTMMGIPEDPGITPKLCDRLFEYLQDAAVGNEILDNRVTVSYLEIYNEKVRDLLCDEETDEDKLRRKKTPLKVREHPKKGPYVQGLSEHAAFGPSDLLDWLEKGNKRRKVAATLSNPRSSRSHSVFSVDCDGAKLNLIDLAGSERASNRCFDVCRFKEGANINKSLVALGNVISALAEQSTKQKGIRRKFVPYRDSVLTWLLKDILGGNSNTFMVATVSPSSACYSETINTLRFGQRAKNIVARPVVNEDPKEKTIRELRAEIYRLREVLKGLQISPHTQMIDEFLSEEPVEAITKPSGSATPPNPRIESVAEPHSNPTQVKNSDQERIRSVVTNTERLLPLIDVTSSVKSARLARLRRTFSVDQPPVAKMATKTFGSDDSLPSTKSATPSSESLSSRRSSVVQPSPRRKSLNKSVQSLSRETTLEKAVSTKAVESKVDSIRRRPAKPRSQIVAAVTSRLYSKPKIKEASTDTDDINVYDLEAVAPKELQICENARNRLKEMTRRALRAHRSRNEETQTDFQSARRVKETATDVSDLRLESLEVREAETMCDPVRTREAAVSCSEEQAKTCTRSCGTQSEHGVEGGRPWEPMSFTKYLNEDLPPHPIYANSVSITISNNYLNGEKVSEENGVQTSAQEQQDKPVAAACLVTPDLLSNHNSLEHNQAVKETPKPHRANIEEIDDVFVEVAEGRPAFDGGFAVADCSVVPNLCSSCSSVKLTKTHATETWTNESHRGEFCLPLQPFEPSRGVPRVSVAGRSQLESVVSVKEPLLLLKSIVKHQGAGEHDGEARSGPMDSLDYHRSNRRVRFVDDRRGDQKRVFEAVSSFLEEATAMMSKLEKSTSTSLIDDLRRVKQPTCPVHGKLADNKSSQTASPRTASSSTQCDDAFSGLPINKYEVALEDSCNRLEDRIRWMPETRPRPALSDFCDDTSQDLVEGQEISDPEDPNGAVAFSDYGSLPRRRYTTWSRCSPSAYLRQLTQMRRQIVRASREESDDAALR